MTAIETFRETNLRAGSLIKIHQQLAPRGKPGVVHSDLLRAAIVLSVASLDVYIHEKICEEVPPLIDKKLGKQLPEKLMEIIKQEFKHEKLLELFYREWKLNIVSNRVRKHLNERTFQEPAKIEDALKILGLTDLWFSLGQKLHVNKEDAKLYVESYVLRRHQIVHRGDHGSTKKSKNKVTRITRNYAQKCVESISVFVEGIEKVVEEKLATQ